MSRHRPRHHRRPHWILLAVVALLLGSGIASAERGARRQVARRYQSQHEQAARLVDRISNTHGKRAFKTALKFAREHDLPVATVTRGGQPRILVNVPSAKIPAWTAAFSKGACFIEPFFNANKTSKPNWSFLRIGDKSFMEYGRGEGYATSTSSHRSAFPVSLSQQEMRDFSRYIKDSPNGPWSYNGSHPPWRGQNCTNWLTYWAHPFTGVQTNSVVHHGSQLFNNNRSGRLTVMGVMSRELISNFGAEHGGTSW